MESTNLMGDSSFVHRLNTIYVCVYVMACFNITDTKSCELDKKKKLRNLLKLDISNVLFDWHYTLIDCWPLVIHSFKQ